MANADKVMRGGEEFVMRFVRITPKALAAWRELANEPTMPRDNVCMRMKNQRCRRMSDGARFFIYEADGMRYTLCVADGHDVNARTPEVFCCVNVEEYWGDK